MKACERCVQQAADRRHRGRCCCAGATRRSPRRAAACCACSIATIRRARRSTRRPTASTVVPFMPIFNNLVMFDPSVPQNSDKSIVPDLAESWSWNDDKTELTFKLRRGVKWHDGWPFTSSDVECTFNLLTGRARDKLRHNPRGAWYGNINYVHGSERLRGHDLPQPAAAVAAVAARLGLLADLSLPCAGGADAHQADRHRPVQARLVQAVRPRQAGAQPGLLEAGPALSRRHRVHHRLQPARRRC